MSDDYCSAFYRHWAESRFLKSAALANNDPRHWLEAAYLAGYVVECGLKAMRPAHGHDLSRLAGRVGGVLSNRPQIISLAEQVEMDGWGTALRYASTPTSSNTRGYQRIVEDAHKFADAVVSFSLLQNCP